MATENVWSLICSWTLKKIAVLSFFFSFEDLLIHNFWIKQETKKPKLHVWHLNPVYIERALTKSQVLKTKVSKNSESQSES